MNDAAAIQSAVSPAVLADLEAAKDDLRASLPGVVRALWFGGVWGWLIGVVFDFLFKWIGARLATFIRGLKVGDILDALAALSAVAGDPVKATAETPHYAAFESSDRTWYVLGDNGTIVCRCVDEADARDIALIKNHNAGVAPAA